MTRYLSVWIGGGHAPEAPLITPGRLADWCRRFTPLAAADPPDGAMLDISGAAHLFGGEAALANEIERRLSRLGFDPRAAVAATPEAAWALARHGRARIAPEDIDETGLRRLFGPLPLAALRLDKGTIYALSQAGLKRIEDVLTRPRAPIAARFGDQVFARLDGLMGRAKNPITPRFEAPAYLVERRFAEAISLREDVQGVIAALAHDLSRLLERHGEGARRLEASLFRVDGGCKRIEAGASRPLRDPQTIAMLFAERIAAASEANEDDPFDAGYGFDLMRLSALEVETLGARQDRLGGRAPLTDAGQIRSSPPAATLPFPASNDEDLADLIDRLGARLGARRVTRLMPQETHIPEFAALSISAARMGRAAVNASWARPTPSPAGMEPFPTRPLRLFEPPEMVEAVAEVPEGPPLRFRWRRVMHEVVAVEGPERIAPEWWKARAAALTRDYYRVEDDKGGRFWLFREGLYGAETARPRWYVHGLFA